MRESTLPIDISIGSNTVSFGEMHRLFAETDDGKFLKSKIRYSTYKPASVSNEQWEHVLGYDVNNLEHGGRVSYGIGRGFLAYCRNPQDGWNKPVPPEATYAQDEEQDLLATCVGHDWGESRGKGDISLLLKTKEDEVAEMEHLREIFRGMFGAESAEDEELLIERMISIDNEKTTKLGQTFNAIERIGYVRTGLRAQLERPNHTGELGAALERLSLEVVPYHIPKLVSYADIYPPVYSFLKKNERGISTVIDEAQVRGIRADNKMDSSVIPTIWYGKFLPSLTA